jgi:hypothetical protein
MKPDKTVSVEKLKSILIQFRDKRNWAQFYDRKNLPEAITKSDTGQGAWVCNSESQKLHGLIGLGVISDPFSVGLKR